MRGRRAVVRSALLAAALAGCGGAKNAAPSGGGDAAGPGKTATAAPPSADALVVVCNSDVGGPIASVKVWRDATGAVQTLEQTPDLDKRGAHAPSVFFDATGKEKGRIASRPVEKGSPEAAEFQRQRDALTGGLTAGESIVCGARWAPVVTDETTGAQMYQRLGCIACHSLDGTDKPAGGSMKGVAGTERTLADGTKVMADDAYLRESILDPNAKLVTGYNPVMPTYRGQITDAQLGRLVDYLKTLTK